jgi:hypothetical protein
MYRHAGPLIVMIGENNEIKALGLKISNATITLDRRFYEGFYLSG